MALESDLRVPILSMVLLLGRVWMKTSFASFLLFFLCSKVEAKGESKSKRLVLARMLRTTNDGKMLFK